MTTSQLSRQQTYEEWKANLNHEGWKHIGEWAFPKRSNSSYSYVFYHWCGDRHRRIDGGRMQATKCSWCDAEVPDGIKMIALLEKL